MKHASMLYYNDNLTYFVAKRITIFSPALRPHFQKEQLKEAKIGHHKKRHLRMSDDKIATSLRLHALISARINRWKCVHATDKWIWSRSRVAREAVSWNMVHMHEMRKIQKLIWTDRKGDTCVPVTDEIQSRMSTIPRTFGFQERNRIGAHICN